VTTAEFEEVALQSPLNSYSYYFSLLILWGYFNMPICLYKQGFIDLSLILQAVKCHAASSPSKTATNPRPTYAIFV